MIYIEDTIQESIIREVRHLYPNSLIYAIPNGGKRNSREASRLKKQGVLSGVSDLHLIHNKKIYFIEVKKDKGRQTDNQMLFESIVKSNGFEYWIVKSADEVLKKIEIINKQNG